MKLDVRIPAGLMFAVMGLLLAGYGVMGDPSGYAKTLGINVDLIWGIVLICASACLLGLAWSSRDRST
jgi:hypothetical protein